MPPKPMDEKKGKPDLYIDVDGVMLFLDKTENDWLLLWIQASRERFNRLFWLSCWTCMGNTETLYKKHPGFKILEPITALKWNNHKTEAIDWTRPFIWIEDGITSEEKEIFKKKAVAGQHVWETLSGEDCEVLIGRLKP